MSVPITSVHVLGSIDEKGAGPSYSVPALVRGLGTCGVRSEIHSLRGWRGAEEAATAETASLTVQRHAIDDGYFGRALGKSASLRDALAAASATPTVLHAHGLWLMPNVYPAQVAARRKTPTKLVLSPRGMLGAGALKFSGLKKKAFWYALQRQAVQRTHLIHATAASEYEDVRGFGITAPVCVIPNGIDLPDIGTTASHASKPQKTLLTVGRVHPKKGLDRLVRAWREVSDEFPDWQVVIAGPPELDHDEELRALATDLCTERLTIRGAAYGDEKAALYASSDLFVLPTLNENFAMTVAEALSYKLPVISTKGAPWAGLEENSCGWWIDHGVEPLAQTLRVALAQPADERAAFGDNGREWMARDFGWDGIAEKMAAAYQWLFDGGELPDTIRLD